MYFRGIRRWYYDNKIKIWTTIFIVIGIIFFVQIANSYYINKSKNDVQVGKQEENAKKKKLEEINNNITGSLTQDRSPISGVSMDKAQLKSDCSLIDEFINDCNSNKTQEAYELLTDECKELFYPTIDDFKNIYYQNLYSTKKTYKLENWIGNTYKVIFMEDALTTGKIGSNEMIKQDYFTIVDNRLNINSYIGRKKIDKISKSNEIYFNVIYKDIFMDYEIYNLDIKNLSEKIVFLDDETNTKSIAIQDTNEVKNYLYSGELNYDNLKLAPGQTINLRLKFQKLFL